MPGPSSRTIELAVGERHVDRPVVRAPLARVVEQVRDGALDAQAVAADQAGLEAAREVHAAAAGAHALDAGRDERVELELFEFALRRLLARELDEVADQRGQLAQLGQQVLAQLQALLGRELAAAGE